MGCWNTGFVRVAAQDAAGSPPTPPTVGNELVFWGVAAAQSPPTGVVSAWDSTAVVTAAGSYTFTSPNGNYIGIAVPRTFTQPTSFVFNGFAVGFAHSEVVLVIDGVLTVYDVYTSPQTSFAGTITLVVS